MEVVEEVVDVEAVDEEGSVVEPIVVDDGDSVAVVVAVVVVVAAVEFSGTVGADERPFTLQVTAMATPNITSALMMGTRLMSQSR
jgi:hypothetical protein